MASLVLMAGVGVFGRVLADNGSEGGNGGDNGNSATAGIGSAVSAAVHSVQSSQDGVTSESESGNNSTKESLSVNASGAFSMTGVTVVSVDASANTITGMLYGVMKTVSVAGATITGGGASITLSSVRPGDKLSVNGTFDESTQSATISSVNDVSYATQNTAGVQTQINQLLQLVQQLQAQLQAMQHASSSN